MSLPWREPACQVMRAHVMSSSDDGRSAGAEVGKSEASEVASEVTESSSSLAFALGWRSEEKKKSAGACGEVPRLLRTQG